MWAEELKFYGVNCVDLSCQNQNDTMACFVLMAYFPSFDKFFKKMFLIVGLK